MITESKITQKIDKQKILFADQFKYTVNIPLQDMAKDNSTLYVNPPIEVKDTVEIVRTDFDTINIDGKDCLNIDYTLTSYAVGQNVLRTKGGDSMMFEVVPVKIDTTKTEIKDIKANAKEGFTISEISPILYSLLGLLVLVAAIYFGIKLWKKYHKKTIKEIFSKPEPVLPAHIIALNGLETLRQKRLLDSLLFKEYFSELSEIIREYLYNRFEVSAIEMTTEEIILELESMTDITKSDKALLIDVLQNSDLVKFAKFIPESHIADRCMKSAIEIVNNTKQEEVVETQEKGGEK